MKKLLIASSIALCLNTAYTPSASANSYSPDPKQETKERTNEAIGFGSGAIAGAAVGGPIGAIIGGMFGIFIADDINGDGQLLDAKETLAHAEQRLAKQQENIVALQSNIQKMQQQQMIQLASYDEASSATWLNELANFETNLQFKTASFLVEEVYQSQLNSLASILSSYPQLKVKVTGYADKRGDSVYNKTLSEKRAQAVKEYLLNNSVKASQISVSGEGETSITSTNTNNEFVSEDLFFARKVNVSLVKPNQQMTAAN